MNSPIWDDPLQAAEDTLNMIHYVKALEATPRGRCLLVAADRFFSEGATLCCDDATLEALAGVILLGLHRPLLRRCVRHPISCPQGLTSDAGARVTSNSGEQQKS